MTKFQVTLNFSVDQHVCDDGWSERKQMKKKQAAFDRTDKYYEDHDIIASIKSNDAMEMVGYILCDGEVLTAEWDPERFSIHMTVETDQSQEDLRKDLEMNSLEDGEYEASGETGWILFTRDEEGNSYQGGEGSDDVWEYALIDYRSNPILIQAAS